MGFSDQEEELTSSQETPDTGEPESVETSATMDPSEPPLESSPDEVETPASEEGDLVDSSEAEISGSEAETGDEAETQEPATESVEASPVTDSSPEKTGDDPDGLDLSFLDEDQAGVDESDEDGRSWYVVHCYSGYENKVRHNLEQRIETMGMKNMIFDIVVPTEEEIEVKEGKRRTVERRVFPGYILVNMIMTEESWYVVRNTPGVTGFVGMGNSPTPLRPEEVSQIIKRMEAEAPRIKVTFKSGERVRIVDGPFNDFRGTVSEIDMERAKVRVMVNFFGRETPVELDFLQVEKT